MKRTIKAAALLTGCAGMALLASGCGTTTINLNDYLVIDYEGYDGYGAATVSLDCDAIDEDYGNKVSIKSGSLLEYESIGEILSDCAGMELSEDENLSNGDSISVSWDVWDEYIDNYVSGSVDVTYEKQSFTVSGLKGITEVDAFEGVEVTFSGTAPLAYAELTVSGDIPASYYSISQSKGLDLEDIVTVSIDENYVESIIELTGTKPKELSKDYTVEGVAHYMKSMDEISDEAMQAMEEVSEGAFSRNVSSTWRSPFYLKSLEHIGNYYLHKESYTYYGVIMLIYEYHVDYNGEDATGYWVCCFEPSAVTTDGSISIDYDDFSINRNGIFSNLFEDGCSYFFDGSESLDMLYYWCIQSMIDTYPEYSVEIDLD